MNAILQLVLETFLHPRQIAEGVIAERYNRATLWTGFFLVVVLVGIVQFVSVLVKPAPETTPDTEAIVLLLNSLFATPFMATLSLGCLLIVSVFAVSFGGQMIGGTGQFPETLALMTWLQFVSAAMGGVVVVLLAISSQLSDVAQVFIIVMNVGIFYATLHFIDVLHGFGSLWAAFGTLVISTVFMLVGLAMIVVFIGGAAAQPGAI